jgi:amidohydrolase
MDTALLRDLTAEDAELDGWVVACRRALHSRPELSGQEEETQAYLLARLEELGIPASTYPGSHGVVGLIRGGLPGPTVALRADMDALPLDEPEGAPFRSTNPGAMHACGHDAHMAVQLGAARLLNARRDGMRGHVKLLFEPAEETTGGAREMIAAGCLEDPRVDAVLGMHVSPKQPTGVLATRPGATHGSSDDILLTLRGRAGHGAYPERSVDALVMAAQVILALQTLISRETSPLDSAVLSLGIIHGGTAPNIICDEVTIRGTLRALRPETRARLCKRIAEVTAHTCAALGGDGEAVLHDGYDATINDATLTERALEVARAVLGQERIHIDACASLGVESFGFFTQERPGVYWSMGCGLGPPLHARKFSVDERCLSAATRAQAAIARELLLELEASQA